MGRFGATLKQTAATRTNNHAAATKAKAEIRRLVLEEIGPERAVVFDAFAGDGAMWRAVWHRAAGYVGCDMEWYRDEREAFVADNRRVLRALDLARFTIFDLDAWGSPWEQAIIIAARRPVAAGERIGLTITEGSMLKVKMGGFPIALRMLARVRESAEGGSRSQGELTQRALDGLCQRMRVKPLRRWQAHGRTGAQVSYLGVVVEGVGR